MSQPFLQFLSNALGVMYLFCWGFCNVPQFILNQQRKSVAGFSITFQCLNMVGFVNYFIFLVYGYWYQHHHNITQSIVWQDFVWCSTTLFFVYATAVQCWIFRKTITESIHPFYQLSIFSIILLSLYNFALTLGHQLPWWSEAEGFKAFSFMHFLGYTKTYVSFIKYVPQVMLNFRSQSTLGFSIVQVLLDIGGASTSFLQTVVNAYLQGDEDGPNFETIFGNLPKLILSMESVFFCGILTFQHYILYSKQNAILLQQQKDSDETAIDGGDNDNGSDIGLHNLINTPKHNNQDDEDNEFDEKQSLL